MIRHDKCPICGAEELIDDRELKQNEKLIITCSLCQTKYPSPTSKEQAIAVRKDQAEKIFAIMELRIQQDQKVYDFLQSQISATEKNPEDFYTVAVLREILGATLKILTDDDYMFSGKF